MMAYRSEATADNVRAHLTSIVRLGMTKTSNAKLHEAWEMFEQQTAHNDEHTWWLLSAQDMLSAVQEQVLAIVRTGKSAPDWAGLMQFIIAINARQLAQYHEAEGKSHKDESKQPVQDADDEDAPHLDLIAVRDWAAHHKVPLAAVMPDATESSARAH